ncbi:MAG TPA: branched-chain amino acid ABC transporter permease, partial [Burkholderiales bacterium]|nr:branched-chain amino acid ABC transporter permease [Burkholderiales bacterium]
MLTILLDGIAYGMLLFVLACGLAVTLGLMNFINLAHGAFAMAGGYIAVLLTTRLEWPFLLALPAAFAGAAAIGAVLFLLLFRHVYRKSHLEQALFTIGVVFMAVAAVDYLMGSQQQFARLPGYLQGRVEFQGLGLRAYRLFIIVLCALLAVLLQWMLSRTRFGSL